MFGTMNSGANAYSKVGVETGVLAASPHKLIVMLFEGAEVALRNARQQMNAGDTGAKGRSISKAILIIENGLRDSLDRKAGGEIAENLASLYEYMVGRLLEANLKNSDALIGEVLSLLSELKQGWEAIAPAAAPLPAAAPRAVAANSYDSLAPRASTYVSA